MRTQLLCTFTKKNKLSDIVVTITDSYEILFNKIFVLQEEETNDTKLMCTYNIDIESSNIMLPNTISLHRKKETNTLYTINALNELIVLLNDGELDKKFPMPWQNYKNCLLITNENGFKKIKTIIYDIIYI